MMNINLNHLEAFCILTETLSFSKTAKLLNTSQPAITRKIKILEANIGYELFIRSNKSIKLTQKGMELRDKVLPSYHELIGNIALKSAEKIKLNIGSIYEAGIRILVPTLGEMAKSFEFNFNLKLRSSVELLNGLNSGELDFILIHYLPNQKSLVSYEVFKDQAVLIGPKKFNSSVEKLSLIPLISYHEDDIYTDNFLKRNFNKKIINKMKVVATVNSHLGMISLIKKLNAYAVIPLSSIPSNELDKLTIVKQENRTYSIYLCARENFISNIGQGKIVKEVVSYMKKIKN